MGATVGVAAGTGVAADGVAAAGVAAVVGVAAEAGVPGAPPTQEFVAETVVAAPCAAVGRRIEAGGERSLLCPLAGLSTTVLKVRPGLCGRGNGGTPGDTTGLIWP